MNKIFLPLLLTYSLLSSGCALLPRITFDRPGVVPTSTQKSFKKESCNGNYTVNTEGTIISCSKGYYNNEQNFTQAERKYTISEKVANFIRGLAGWGFWLLALALIFVPGFFGWLVGSLFNGARRALTATVQAIGNFKSKVPTITVNGEEVPDPNYVKAVDALLDELENAHSKDPAILTTISHIRLKLKIEDND